MRICLMHASFLLMRESASLENSRWRRGLAGGCHDTQGTGDLTVRFLQKDGKFRSLGDIGQAALVDGLMYNLLSVSQLCRHSFEVVFKRHGSRIVTPDGVVIPVHDDNGLYFVPTYSLPTETRAKGSKLREVVCSDSDMVMERTSSHLHDGSTVT